MYEPHLRLTMSGEIGGGLEIFSMSLSLEPNGGILGQGVANYLAETIADPLFDDLVGDCTAWFRDPALNVSPRARLTRVKLAHINEDGHYASAPKEAAVSERGAQGGGFLENERAPGPWQISQKCTIHTDGDLGRVKGGFYLPVPSLDDYDPAIDLWTVGHVNAQEAVTKTFFDNLMNEPNLDFLDLRVVVASQGRRNKDGSVRLAPDNHRATGVSFGRRPDVQRRRANKVSEARTTPETLSP